MDRYRSRQRIVRETELALATQLRQPRCALCARRLLRRTPSVPLEVQREDLAAALGASALVGATRRPAA
jgi:hypothetical protein